MARGVETLMPRSRAATRNRAGVPAGGLTAYGSGVVTSRARSAPAMPGLASTRGRRSLGSWVSVLIAARMAPRSRRCLVSARVPLIAMPVTPWVASSAARLRRDRQDEAILAGSRIT